LMYKSGKFQDRREAIMVKLEIGKVLTTFDGKPISGIDGPMVLKDVLLHYLGTFHSKNGKSMIGAFTLGQKIAKETDESITLENAEFLLLKEAVQNPVHGALIFGQLQYEMEVAEAGKFEAAKG
jgi:hypothetical protein